jgi:hypothetical protein
MAWCRKSRLPDSSKPSTESGSYSVGFRVPGFELNPKLDARDSKLN